MNKLVPTIVLGFALGGAAVASDDPGATPFHGGDQQTDRGQTHGHRHDPGVRPFFADVSGAIVVSGSQFFETGWTGHATHLGAIGWDAEGTITVTSSVGSLLYITAHADFTATAANGDALYGTFDTTGTFDLASGAINTTGTFVISGGTGRFTHARGGGTAGATGTASDASCPLPGWIEY